MLITTKLFDEQLGGILLCGINWAATYGDCVTVDPVSFFSDEKANPSRFKSRVINWFTIFGRPLNTENPGPLEKSIFHTNWLTDISKRSEGRDSVDLLVDDDRNILSVLKTFRPKVIFFFSVNLLHALEILRAKPEFKSILGEKVKAPTIVSTGGPNIVIAEYENCKVISLPHPTGCRKLSNAHIEANCEEIKDILATFEKGLLA